MQNDPLIDEITLDVTAGKIESKLRINYLPFGRYKVGIIEDEDHRAIGIYSIEVVRDFYEIDQVEGDKFYWDPEDYYD